MMRKHGYLKLFGILIAVLCAFCSFGVVKPQVLAEEQGYEWKETKCISIAPPYCYTDYGLVIFQVSFDTDITAVNYKHLAAGATALKTFDSYTIPNMTHGTIDNLDASGVLDSLNDCIAFNGVKVREMQKFGVTACGIHVGELGANNTMSIEFSGSIDAVKITNLEQPFTFTFYEGLKFPSGVELKETVTWKYNPENLTFSQVPNQTNPNDASFTVYYNGQKITKENNLVTIYDKQAFSLDNLSIHTNDINATYEVKQDFDSLEDGFNYVLVTCRSENRLQTQRLQIVFDLQQHKVSNLTWLKIFLFVGVPLVVLGVGAFVTIKLIKRGKKPCEQKDV